MSKKKAGEPKEEIQVTERDKERYGEPIRIEKVKETGEVFVLWRKQIIHPDYKKEMERQYFVTKWDPRKGVHREAGHLNVRYQPSAKGEVRMAHVEVEKMFRNRNVGLMLHSVMQEEHAGKGMWLAAVPETVSFHEKAGYIRGHPTGYTGEIFMHRPPGEPPVKAEIKPKLSLLERMRRMFKRRK